MKIAEYVVQNMADGSTLQLGIGSLPNAVGQMIARSDLRDLGIHTEMLCDSYLDMYKAGGSRTARRRSTAIRASSALPPARRICTTGSARTPAS